jgi:hypothetical protein
MLFYPFYGASAPFGDASSETAALPPVVYPNVKYPGRIDKSTGRFKALARLDGRFRRPSATPTHVATALMRL